MYMLVCACVSSTSPRSRSSMGSCGKPECSLQYKKMDLHACRSVVIALYNLINPEHSYGDMLQWRSFGAFFSSVAGHAFDLVARRRFGGGLLAPVSVLLSRFLLPFGFDSAFCLSVSLASPLQDPSFGLRPFFFPIISPCLLKLATDLSCGSATSVKGTSGIPLPYL